MCPKTKHRTNNEKSNLIKRLNVIEGQVRGIKQMIENDRYCDDVITQLSAVNRSLKSIGNEMLRSHLESCVVDDIKSGKPEIIDEVINLFDKLNK